MKSRPGAIGATLDTGVSSQPLDLAALYAHHGAFVQRAVTNLGGPGLDIEDLVQDVFVHAARGWGSFQGRSSARTWLFGIALGVVRNARRRARFRRFLGLEQVPERQTTDPGPAELYENAEAGRILHELMDRLSEDRRTVLVLFEFEGLRSDEIAELLGCSVQVVWNRLFQARREILGHYERAKQADPEYPWRRP